MEDQNNKNMEKTVASEAQRLLQASVLIRQQAREFNQFLKANRQYANRTQTFNDAVEARYNLRVANTLITDSMK